MEEQQDRFKPLEPNDFVLFEFIGEIVPDQARALFIAKAKTEDLPLYNAFDPILPAAPRAMCTVTAEQLANLIRAAPNLAGDHPAHEFTLDADMEDAALGGQQGVTRLRNRRARRTITLDDLRRARVTAEQNGQKGEQFVNEYLSGRQFEGAIAGFTWTSLNDPLCPYDFEVSDQTGSNYRLDVKSTDGEFDRRIHISYGELQTMADVSVRYDLYRVYSMTDDTALMQIASNLGSWAAKVLSVLSGLGASIWVDGVSVNPGTLPFGGNEVTLTLTTEED